MRLVAVLLLVFQSTHPRRVRPRYRLYASVTKSFNPRTHVGCDAHRGQPPREILRFNPRTHVGCDLPTPPNETGGTRFQSTHPRRVRRLARSACVTQLPFQSTHPRRVRQRVSAVLAIMFCINLPSHIKPDIIQRFGKKVFLILNNDSNRIQAQEAQKNTEEHAENL